MQQMTVDQFIRQVQGVDSYGFYNKNGELATARTEPSPQEVLLFSNNIVGKINIFIYDDYIVDINGHKQKTKRIRACIYFIV